MTALKPCDFPDFFRALHGYEPFPWQARLAGRVCSNTEMPASWPHCIALPTAAGKTACIDIAVFALACEAALAPEKRTAPRRILFVVDRRVVVDQAYDHARKLADALRNATNGILGRVVAALRQFGADEKRPLDVYALRGGMYRESAWVRSPLQPTVITSTVDQVGSRLLFRGYGVSDASKPLHAALVGNDALILLDEAHCAKPFEQTISLVKKYRGWIHGSHAFPLPFHFVSMTATPSAGTPKKEIERLGEDDRQHNVLGKRIAATKLARLVIADKAKGAKWREELTNLLVEHARYLKDKGYRAVGIIVNRVATARDAAAKLRSEFGASAEVILLTGRMRPVDRDGIMNKIEPLLSKHSNNDNRDMRPIFVVATQTIEVGADLDFHALVTECASLDALRQRFGRLNRVAARDKAEAVIVVRADQVNPEADETTGDPVYGNSLALTWKWLNTKAQERILEHSTVAEEPPRNDDPANGKHRRAKNNATGASAPIATAKVLDFGVAAMEEHTRDMTPEQIAELNAPALDAAVLLLAHLDIWCQTSPRPTPEPDPSYFLHGPLRGEPEVQVVFRADLGDDETRWAEIVSLCPPSSSEALSVRLRDFTRWLRCDGIDETSSDVEGQRVEEPNKAEDERKAPTPATRRVLRWRGPDARETSVILGGERVTPNDLYVVSIATNDQRAEAATLGDFPISDDGTPRITDAGDEAFQRSHDRALLRLRHALYSHIDADWDTSDFPNLDGDEVETRVDNVLKLLLAHGSPSVQTAAKHLGSQRNRAVEFHPLGGLVLISKRRLHQFDPTFVEPEDSWEAVSDRPYPLADHCRDVANISKLHAQRSGLNALAAAIERAAELHDIGKADPRFQMWLHGGNSRRAAACTTLYAKSAVPVRSRSELLDFRERARYPVGARHELYSTAMAAHPSSSALAGIDPALHDLILHLVASHHGYARPFAPIAIGDLDREIPTTRSSSEPRAAVSGPARSFTCPCNSATVEFTPDSSISGHGLERAGSGVAERFWRLTRCYGWWGLPYLEALLRLADWACSGPPELVGEKGRSTNSSVSTSTVLPAFPEAVS